MSDCRLCGERDFVCNGPVRPGLRLWGCFWWGEGFCSEVSWNCGILVEFESTQMAFNCPLFFLVFLPASSAFVLVPRLHHHLQTASARVEPWKALERWEGTRLPSTEEIQGGILALTSVADTNRIKLSPVRPKERNFGRPHRVQLGGEGGHFKDS